jgi:dienelactone hydrolase
VPYYQSRTNILTGRWLTGTGAEVTRYTALAGAPPAATETMNVPILVSVPNAGSPSGGTPPGAGWPVVLFQHGITQNRTNLLPLAQAAANAGFAVVAVDHPLHGLPPAHPLRIAVPGVTITEPTFDADVSNNATRAPGADGTVDASGQNYINLSSLLTSRDNLRQTVAHLIRVVKTIPTLDVDANLDGDFDASRIHFAGHSLGGITGTTFLGVNTDTQAATLAMPGGTIARLLRDSPTFSVSINAGLAANGVVNGTQLYEQFMQAAQTVVDSGDPINFAAAANANHAIHLIQVVGTSAATQDQVVPNSATARLIAALGLAKRSAVGANGPDGYVNFTAGDHSSILNPAASAAATVEMQTQFANFMGSNGAAIVITNAAVIEP